MTVHLRAVFKGHETVENEDSVFSTLGCSTAHRDGSLQVLYNPGCRVLLLCIGVDASIELCR